MEENDTDSTPEQGERRPSGISETASISKISLETLKGEEIKSISTDFIGGFINLTKETIFWIFVVSAFIILAFVILGQTIYSSISDQGGQQAETATSKAQDCRSHEVMIGDGLCDEVTNNELCLYDGGDCCLERKSTPLCVDCTCKIAVDLDQLEARLAEHKILVTAQPINAFIADAPFETTKEVDEVLDTFVCSLICLDMLMISATNAWIFNENGQNTCICGFLCLDNNIDQTQLQNFTRELFDQEISEGPVTFIKTDTVINNPSCNTNSIPTKKDHTHTDSSLTDKHNVITQEASTDISLTDNVSTQESPTGVSTTEHEFQSNTSDFKCSDRSSEFVHASNLNKILYTSGALDEGRQEILDLTSRYLSPPSNCQLKVASGVVLQEKQQGVGGLLQEQVPIYCSGLWKPSSQDCGSLSGGQECITYTNTDGIGWTISNSLQLTERYEAAAIVLHGDTELFLIGGIENRCGIVLDTTEFVSAQQVRTGPKLLAAMYATCFIKYNDSHAITVGGFTGSSAVSDTYIYSIDSETDGHWSNGPPLTIARGVYHACGSLIDTGDDDLYVVTLGGIKIHNGYQWYDVFEYWKPRGSLFEWTAVNERLPEEFYYPLINQNDLRPMVFGIEMVGTPGGKSVILFGGDLFKHVFELKVTCGLFEAKKLTLQLQSHQKYYGAAFLVPDSFVVCD